MEQLPLHPAVVHLPIALALLMPLLAGGLLLAWWRGALPRRAWLIGVAMQALLVVTGLASLRTGEAEEERVEAVVPESAIEAHEEAAEAFVFAGAAALLLTIAAAAVRNEKVARPLAGVATVATLAVLGLGYRTGEAGGRLVYQHDAGRAYVAAPAGAPPIAADED